MKKTLSAFLAFIFSLSVNAQAPNWGIADTLEHHSLGPGIQFTKIRYKDKPLLIWVTTIDLTNPNNKIEQVQSHNKVPDVARETVMDMSKNNTYQNHKVCAAFNHDFFSYEQGICIGVNVNNGEIPYSSGWGRSLFAISEGKTASVFAPNLDAKVNLTDGSSVKIDFFNSQALGLTGDCILFNRLNALTLTESGKYIKIKPLSKWTLNGPDIDCEVLEVSDSPLQTSQTEYVIYARGSKLTAFDGKIKAGDKISISQKLANGKFGTPAQNIVNAFHGYPSIAYEGKLHDGEYNDFENGREYEVSARVMAGMSQDGKTVYIVTVESGSRNSVGVNCIDIANWMLAHGSWNVVNFDSGGSVAIVVDHEMLNYPERGSVRPVEDGLLVVSTAEESSEVASYAFITPTLTASEISLSPLTLYSFNKNGEVLEKNIQGFTFSCIPEDLGIVDENGVFHAGNKIQQGKILATKDGLTAELAVNVRSLSDIKVSPTNILLDGVRRFPVRLEGTVDNKQYLLDPSAFVWSSSNPACCVVENGILRGIATGKTTLQGTYGGKEVVVEVSVEIAAKERVHENFSDMSLFVVNKNSPVLNLRFENSNLPLGWTDGTNMAFDITSGRLPYIELVKPVVFYSLPDSMSIQLKASANAVKNIQFFLSSATKADYKLVEMTLPSQKDSVFVIPFSEGGPLETTEYPITLNKMKINLVSSAMTGITLSMRDLKAYYPVLTGVGIPEISLIKKGAYITTINGEAVLHYNMPEPGKASASLWTMDGRKLGTLFSTTQPAGEHTCSVPFNGVNPGIYMLQMILNGKMEILKFVVSK
ncbi:phosphodiester glycosidase family protein [Bacteroides sedimenti]|uniref:Phosphodiester glycosidase domain-containing protein n=1 Tax=Bacteroides sedimenti TaxID=2136147 RepID=A0ABN6Z6F0_9BACE